MKNLDSGYDSPKHISFIITNSEVQSTLCVVNLLRTFKHFAGGIFQIANIVLGLINYLHTDRQAVKNVP